jgi:hypothetical protein
MQHCIMHEPAKLFVIGQVRKLLSASMGSLIIVRTMAAYHST